MDLEVQIKDPLTVFALSWNRQITLFEGGSRCHIYLESESEDANRFMLGSLDGAGSRYVPELQKISCKGPDGLNLVDGLGNWRPVVGELQSSKEFRGNWLKSVAEIFEDLGLNPTSSGRYILNASTAVKWIGLIATILTVLNQMFEEEEQSTSKVLDPDRGSSGYYLYACTLCDFFQ